VVDDDLQGSVNRSNPHIYPGTLYRPTIFGDGNREYWFVCWIDAAMYGDRAFIK